VYVGGCVRRGGWRKKARQPVGRHPPRQARLQPLIVAAETPISFEIFVLLIPVAAKSRPRWRIAGGDPVSARSVRWESLPIGRRRL
jgi:hypothetical protein